MTPLILKSSLTKPPRWYVVTRYTLREGGTVVAHRKYDVTEQIEQIIRTESRAK